MTRTEYRVVATLDTKHNYNGKEYHYEAADCWWDGRPYKIQTFDKAKAEQYLKEAKEKCPEFDKETQSRTGRDTIYYWQTNIRIQTREVSDWK